MPIVCLGIDPGLRSTGIGAVERMDDGTYRTRGVRLSRTTPEKGKAFSRMRTSADDARRLREHWHNLSSAIELIKPDVIAVENYLIFEPRDVGELRAKAQMLTGFLPGVPSQDVLQTVAADAALAQRFGAAMGQLSQVAARGTGSAIGLGQAAKTVAVYGVALGAAYTAGVPVFVFEPGDRTRRIAQKKGASKEEVGRAVEAIVTGLDVVMKEKVPQKTLKEHAWDASALAVLGAEEYHRLRLDHGVA